MKARFLMLALAAVPALSAPALAQSYSEQRAWEAAQRRYDAETRLYQQARDRYEAAAQRGRGGDYRRDGYNNSYNGYNGYNSGSYNGAYNSGYRSGYDSNPGAYATDYDASRYYRDDPRYQERVLSTNDEVYRGSDGRYYCKRSDGTTGLIIGGAAGGLLGNVIDGGHNRVAGTLIGGALGAILGKKAEQNQQEIRCR